MRLFFTLLSGSILGGLVVILSVSFTAIVYAGPLEVFLPRGIGMTLLGAGLAAAVGALLYSHRGTTSNPQDLTAILLAGAAAQIAATGVGAPDETLFATIVMLLVTASFATGVVALAMGKLRLSHVVRFIPYPVMGGFLAATGYLLVLGALGTLLGRPLDIWTLQTLLAPDAATKVLPWMLAGMAVLIATKVVRSDFTLPLAIVLICAAFYLWLYLTGTSLTDAAANGMLLGPFADGGFLSGFGLHLVTDADWGLVATQKLTLIAVVAMALLGAGLNLSGIELVIGRPLDPNRDFIAVGASALVAAPTGGLLGFPGFAATILNHRMGTKGVAPALMVAAICFGTAFFGTSLLEVLPRGLFAATIAYLGFDLLFTWLWSEPRRLMPRDSGLVFVILAISAVFGFLEALGLGLALSIVMFVISYSKQSFVRLRTTLSVRRSTIERDLAEADYLTQTGHRVQIFEFTGYFFFGTAARLKSLLEDTVAQTQQPPEVLILDFSAVQGIDASAAHALHQIVDAVGQSGMTLCLTGLSTDLSNQMRRFNGLTTPHVFADLDAALEHAESLLLQSRDVTESLTFFDELRAISDDVPLDTLFPIETLPAGLQLLSQGDASDELFVLIDGHADVTITTPQGTQSAVARLSPGALIGEVGYFGDSRRSADVILTDTGQLMRITRNRLHELENTNPAFVAAFLGLAAKYLCRRMDRSTRLLAALLR